jgi:hypothetical protein
VRKHITDAGTSLLRRMHSEATASGEVQVTNVEAQHIP